MTKALILIGAGLLAACGHARAQAPAAPVSHDRLATARPEAVPAARPEHSAATIARADAAVSADAADERVIAELEKALELYRAFITLAGDESEYADAVTRSKERMVDIRDTLDFMRQGMRQRQP